MTNQGWQCPSCGYCFSPSYPECTNCNRPHHEKFSTSNNTSGLFAHSNYCGKCHTYHDQSDADHKKECPVEECAELIKDTHNELKKWSFASDEAMFSIKHRIGDQFKKIFGV